VAAQIGPELRERVELLERELAMDHERTEPARAALGELLGDQPHDLRLRGVQEPAQHHAPARRLERPLEELGQPFVGHLRQVRVALDRVAEQRRGVERAVGEPARPGRIDRLDLGLVPVVDVEPVAQLIGGLGRGGPGPGGDPVEQLEQPQLIVARGRAMAIRPRRQHRIGLVERAPLLGVQRPVVIVIFTAW